MNSTDGGLFPASPRHSERYSQRPQSQRVWGTTEDLLLWPILAAAGSDYHYREVCCFLCEALDRNPVYPPGANPDTKTIQDDCVDLIVHRLVTDVLNGKRPSVPRLALLLPAARSGQPLTWAESEKLIPQYVRKLIENKPTVSEEGFYALLGRHHMVDSKAVGDRMKQVRGGKKWPVSPDRRPLPLGNVLVHIVQDFASRDPGDLEDLTKYWEGLARLREYGT